MGQPAMSMPQQGNCMGSMGIQQPGMGMGGMPQQQMG